MQPAIRYTQTTDGVNIAYYAMGSGPTLIAIPAGLHQSIEFDGKIANLRAAADASARVFTYVRYDPRGSGLSDRDVHDFSIEAMARDIEAVGDAVAAEEFMLFAPGPLGLVGTWFTAHHPGRVRRLALWISGIRGDEFNSDAVRTMQDMALSDWRFVSESLIQSVDRWDNPELAREHAAMMRASVEPETYVRNLHGLRNWDVSAVLRDVTCPTLVIHPASHPSFPVARARRLASSIPGARLALVDTPSGLMPNLEVVRTCGRFFLDRESHPPASLDRTHGTEVILFADIADSTALTERLGDAAFRAKARELDTALRATVTNRGGRVIDAKTLGDGILATFRAASQAIDAALACRASGESHGLSVHVGLHAGDVLHEADNVFGGAVNIASRICALSAPGEIQVSGTVRDLGRTSAGVTFDDRGEYTLKGVTDPVHVFTVRL